MIFFGLKRKVSLGYLSASGILAACSARLLSEILCYALGGPLPEFVTYLSIGTILLLLSAILFWVGTKAKRDFK